MKKLVVALLFATLTFSMVACSSTKNEKESEATESQQKDDTEEKEDKAVNKTITVEVKLADGSVTSYEIETDAEFLYDAIVECKDITLDVTEGEYGYYINAVNGEVADYDVDSSYWSLYVNDEYGQYGVETQPIEDGDTYTLAHEFMTME